MTRTPLLDRIAARRSAQESQRGQERRDGVTTPAPTVLPEWRRRMIEQGLPAKEMELAA